MTERYDPVTYVHWRFWRHKVLEVDSMGFQRHQAFVGVRAFF